MDDDDNWSDWSGWVLNEQYQAWGSWRRNLVSGAVQWQWPPEAQSAPPQQQHYASSDGTYGSSPANSGASGSPVRIRPPLPATGSQSHAESSHPAQLSSSRRQEGEALPTISEHVGPNEQASRPDIFDKSYQKVRSNYFQPGIVFSLLWSEPTGKAGHTKAHDMGDAFTEVRYGEKSFTEIRRYIVMRRQSEYHSLCVPIATYQKRGAANRPDREHHSVVYTIGSAEPQALPNENLSNVAIALDPLPGVTLQPASRINFAKTYTVEHNLRVKKLGKVRSDYMAYVELYWKTATVGAS